MDYFADDFILPNFALSFTGTLIKQGDTETLRHTEDTRPLRLPQVMEG